MTFALLSGVYIRTNGFMSVFLPATMSLHRFSHKNEPASRLFAYKIHSKYEGHTLNG